MDLDMRQHFTDHWTTYFPAADLPIAFYYTNDKDVAPAPSPSERSHCFICDLAAVRDGASRAFESETLCCRGARRYLGFDQSIRPNFAYFLSCGIPGEMEGERYKQSPQLVESYLKSQPPFEAPGRYLIAKRWDYLDAEDDPQVVVFFVPPDIMSGLFTLANFDEARPDGVIAPFGSGCSSIVYRPYRELTSDCPRAILGMFDVSARPCVPNDLLTLSIPWPKFARMAKNVDESFLITESWDKVRSRIQGDPL